MRREDASSESAGAPVERMFPSAPWKRLSLFALDATDIALSKLEPNADRVREDVVRLARAGHINPQILRKRDYQELRPYLLSKVAWHFHEPPHSTQMQLATLIGSRVTPPLVSWAAARFTGAVPKPRRCGVAARRLDPETL